MNTSTDQLKSAVVSLADAKRDTDALLDQFFRSRLNDAANMDTDYVRLWQTMYNLFQAKTGGKRFRPYVTILAYQAYSQRGYAHVLPAAAAQELLHLAVLVHDDVIDRTDIRYGIKNVSGQYFDHYAPLLEDETERRHFTNSAAILAGDLLLSSAYQLIQESQIEPALILQAERTLGTAVFNVVGGELLDTEAAFRPFDQISSEKINYYKTAIYSFISPLTMGAQLAGASSTTIQSLSVFGRELGIAFQLQDDILGVFGSEVETGKTSSGDIIEGKHTYMIEQFYRLASPSDRALFDQHFGSITATPDDVRVVRKLLETSGARAANDQAIALHAEQATMVLDSLHLPTEYVDSFLELVALCTKRVK